MKVVLKIGGVDRVGWEVRIRRVEDWEVGSRGKRRNPPWNKKTSFEFLDLFVRVKIDLLVFVFLSVCPKKI